MKRLAIAAFALVTIAAVMFAISRRNVPQQVPQASAARHALLITIDTLRADHVGSYGYAAARTQALDGLAQRGTRFTRAYATAPITLTSHASMMSGRYPPGHGGRHNGLAMDDGVPVLAEVFKQTGFATAAFVSAFPLDRRFGLARGFDTYDDELPRGADGRRTNERPGAATIDRAITWVRAQPASARLFAWVHLFEPHAPYATPGAAQGGTAESRYDDEIAIADQEIGRLLGAWRDLSETLVVAVADHGEAFGEHGEIGHSIFVYDTTLRVPLIVAGPGVGVRTVDDPVTLVDLAPTILGLAQLPVFDGDGIDLRAVMNGQRAASRALYAESFAPLLDFGWAPLRTLRRDATKLIAAPRPELYDLAADRDEQRNIIAERADVARELTARVDRISPPELPRRQGHTDPEVLARLRALGYASGGTSSVDRPDPKDRIEIAARMASITSGEVQGATAERTLRDVLRDDDRNAQAHQRLAFLLAESSRCAEAERHFAAAIASRLPSADPYLGLGLCQASRGAVAESLATLTEARSVEPGNAVVEANIGLTSLELGRLEDAIAALTRALAIDAELHQARFALARGYARAGKRDAAVEQATELLRRLPASAPQRTEVERLLAALR
jgi:choline-sulfatase